MGRLALKLQQRIVGRRRLGRVDIDRGAGEVARAQAIGESRLVDDAAARGLDQHRTLFHAGELARADQPLCRRQQWHVQRHHVGEAH